MAERMINERLFIKRNLLKETQDQKVKIKKYHIIPGTKETSQNFEGFPDSLSSVDQDF